MHKKAWSPSQAFYKRLVKNVTRKKKISEKQKALNAEYRKERRRIQQFIRRAEKRGYKFEYNLPTKPKKVTQSSINRLKKVTPEYLYRRGTYGGEAASGEIVPAAVGVKKERKVRSQKAAVTRKEKKQRESALPYDSYVDVIINNYKGSYHKYTFPTVEVLDRMLIEWVAKYGKAAVAEMISEAADSGVEITFETMYYPNEFSSYILRLVQHMPEVSQLYMDELTDAMESMEYWIDYDHEDVYEKRRYR